MGYRGVLVLLLMTMVGGTAIRHVHFSRERRTWMRAQHRCRDFQDILVSMDTPKEMDAFLNSAAFKIFMGYKPEDNDMAWIGLSREPGSTEWLWSDTGNKLSNQNLNIQITDEAEERCVAVSKSGSFHALNCTRTLARFCYHTDRRIVASFNKTWTNALSYCRMQYMDMASLVTDVLLKRTVEFMKETGQGDLVWIGLRYVRRYWLWMSGDALEFQAWEGGQRFGPQCPEPGHYCGALNLSSGRWVNLDCEEELPALCWH